MEVKGMAITNGWAGTLLNVDLTLGKIEKEPVSPEFAEKYLGGIGFNSARLFDLVKPGVEALSPENVIMFGVGPLAGTIYPGGARLTITAKSPLTDIFGSANVGGFFGNEMKYAGYDQIAVFGKSEKPVYLWIDNDKVELRDASHLWGLSTGETGLRIKEELGDPGIQVLTIGPAGENLVRFASVINPPRGAAGRTGMGAVMGSKNLKAIAARGTGRLKVARPDEFFNICRESTIYGRTEPRYEVLRRGGSPHWMDSAAATGAAGVRNYTKAVSPNWRAVEGDKFKPGAGYSVRKRSCFSCPIGCSGFFNIKDGEFAQTFGRVPEFGMTFISLSCDFYDISAILKSQDLCDQYGLDSVSTGQVISWALDCYDRGILTRQDSDGLSLEWGNYTAVIELISRIARRKGLGDLLAEGEKRAPERLGRGSQKLMNSVKGMAPVIEDPRARKIFGLAYYTAPRGADHLSSNSNWVRDLARDSKLGQGVLNPKRWGPIGSSTKQGNSMVGMGETLTVCENITAIINSAETCTRTVGSLQLLVRALSAATGIEMDEAKALKTGERIFNMEKAFNSREGLTRKDDNFCVPEKFTQEPIGEGPYQGDVLPVEQMLDEYYRVRGWDPETGLQTNAKLKELGLHHLIPELEKVNGVR
jgi:aldehyde:ferredoxin oxidoreductase